MMSVEEEEAIGVIKYMNEGKEMKVKPRYNSANLPYLLFQTPVISWNKSRTKRVNDPNEGGQ
jgi:hypothetical protein